MDQTLYNRIVTSNSHRSIRDTNTNYILEHRELLGDLVALGMAFADKNHHKAMWTLELVVEQNFSIFEPYLPAFLNKLSMWKQDGAQRSAAKIVMLAAIRNHKKRFLADDQLNQIAEQCFDWLISDSKVAVKAYAIYTLAAIGKNHDWIFPELKPILEKEFSCQSPAYRAAAKKVLRQINRD